MEQKVGIKKVTTLTIVAVFLLSLVGQVACSGTNSLPYQVSQELKEEYDTFGVTQLWDMGLTGSGIIVGEIDDGVDYTNPDLGGCLGPNCKVIGGWDFGDNDPDPMACARYHGTLVVSVIAADGEFKGIAPKAKILAYKIYKGQGLGNGQFVGHGFDALEKAIEDGAKVVDWANGNWSETVKVQSYEQSLYQNVEKADVLVLQPAGNNGSAMLNKTFIPNYFVGYYISPVFGYVSKASTLSVGAWNWRNNMMEWYSSMGPSLDFQLQPDIIAPSKVYGTRLPGEYFVFDGTSASAPVATGLAVLIRQAHPEWNIKDLKNAIMNNASVMYNKDNDEPITMLLQGAGLIDALATIKTPAIISPYSISMTATGLTATTITIKNVTDATQTFTASVELTLGNFQYGANDGLKLSLTSTKIVVSPKLTATLGLTGTVDLSVLTKGPHEAIIWFNNGTATLHIPVLIWNDPSSWWWSPDTGASKTPPKKILNSSITTSTLDFVDPKSAKAIKIDFTLGRGSLNPYTLTTTSGLDPTFSDLVDEVRVEILNSEGKVVRTLFDKHDLLIGHYTVTWYGEDDNKQAVPDGTYTYRISSMDTQATATFVPPVDTVTGAIVVKNSSSVKVPFLSIDLPQTPTIYRYVFQPTATVIFKGKTDPGDVVLISIPKLSITSTVSAQPDGSFYAEERLQDGTYDISVISLNPFRNLMNTTTETLTISVVPVSLIELSVGNSTFFVNGVPKVLDSPPIIKNSRTLVPIRAIVETMGGDIKWYPTDRRVDIQYKDQNISLWIGMNIAKVNGKNTMIDPDNPNVVPEIINGRTMLPLRFVAEALGCQVEWIEQTKTIKITYQD